jgi:hypothetical protein
VRRADGGSFLYLSLLSAIGQKTNLALGISPNLAILQNRQDSKRTTQLVEMMNLNTFLSFWHSSCLYK